MRTVYLSTLLCVSLGLCMATERTKKIHGLDGRHVGKAGQPDEDVIDRSPAGDAERAKCLADPKHFYDTVIATEIRNRRTGERKKQTLGKIHCLMLDFAVFDELGAGGVVSNFGLPQWLPKPDERGIYPERWLYFPSLKRAPEIQDGPEGPISAMFHEGKKLWHGVVIRICGSARTTCMLVPREHLKSTLITQSLSLWRICRDPGSRILLRSQTGTVAKLFQASIQDNFDNNPRFRRLFGDLGPPTKDEKIPWNTEMFRVRRPQSSDKEPTLMSVGVLYNVTGLHFSRQLNDDLVGEENTENEAQIQKVCDKVERFEPLRAEPDGAVDNIGTRWNENDAHGKFLCREEELYKDSSFMVATVLDADGEPVWDEHWTREEVLRKLARIKDERFRFGQYFNQFTGTTATMFDPSWPGEYQGKPEDVARAQKLDIYIAVDTASGKKKQRGKLDPTGALVLGQLPDRERYFVLDGFNEKLTAAEIGVACVDLYLKWRDIAAEYGGQVYFGAEDTCYTTYLEPLLAYEMKSRGLDSVFSVRPLEHGNLPKPQRISTLVQPYSEGKVLWPVKLVRPPAKRHNTADNHAPIGNPYDFILMLRTCYDRYSYAGAPHEEPLDCQAYAFQMASGRKQYRQRPSEPAQAVLPDRGRYDRDAVVSGAKTTLPLGGYDKGKWVLLGEDEL